MSTLKPIPTQIGDVLILGTQNRSYQTYAVGLVTTAGQQGFDGQRDVKYFDGETSAIAAAKTMPGGRIFLMNVDTNHWTEVAR